MNLMGKHRHKAGYILSAMGRLRPDERPLVLGAPLPDASPAFLRIIIRKWEKALGPYISPRQRAWLEGFGWDGQALYARASRCLARLLAIRATGGAFLDMDGHGAPFFRKGPALSFSHGGEAAFCLLSPGKAGETALDAAPAEPLEASALAFYFGKLHPAFANCTDKNFLLRLWLLHEASLKISDFRNPESQKRLFTSIAEKGLDCGRGAGLSWHFFVFPGRRLCMASAGGARIAARFQWLGAPVQASDGFPEFLQC